MNVDLPDEVMAIVTAQAEAAGISPIEWLIKAVRGAEVPLSAAGEVLVDDGGFFSPPIPAQVRRTADTRKAADVA